MKSNILDILSAHNIQYKEHPDYIRISCIFHEEKTPSLFIYPNTNSFYCFGCSKVGNIIEVISKITHRPINELRNNGEFKNEQSIVRSRDYSKQANLYLSNEIFNVFNKIGTDKQLLNLISEMDIALNKEKIGIKESVVFIKKYKKKLYNILGG